MRLSIILITLLFTVYSDQYTKSLAKAYLSDLAPISFLSGSVVFSYVENSAGFLGILTGFPDYLQFFMLNICVALIIIYCLYYLLSKKDLPIPQTLALAAITGGGISNLLDRTIGSGAVIDFLQLGIGTARTGIFNLADIFILLGSFCFGFLLLADDS